MNRHIDDIMSITQGGLLYKDEDGQVQWLDFARCNHNWMNARSNLSIVDYRCVGKWHFSPTYFLFYGDTKIKFEMETPIDRTLEDADEKLRIPLSELGGWVFQYDG